MQEGQEGPIDDNCPEAGEIASVKKKRAALTGGLHPDEIVSKKSDASHLYLEEHCFILQ